MTGCILCGHVCESAVRALWECVACKHSREEFMVKLRAIFGETSKTLNH